MMQSMIPGQKMFIKPWMIKLADDNYDLDLSKAKKVLGWEPKHHLSSDIDMLLKNMMKNPEAWYKVNELEPSTAVRHQWRKTRKPKSKRS